MLKTSHRQQKNGSIQYFQRWIFAFIEWPKGQRAATGGRPYRRGVFDLYDSMEVVRHYNKNIRLDSGVFRRHFLERPLYHSFCFIKCHNAVYAYETAAGVFVDSPIMATGDMDILWDVRSRLRLAAKQGDDDASIGIIDLLRKAAWSFERVTK